MQTEPTKYEWLVVVTRTPADDPRDHHFENCLAIIVETTGVLMVIAGKEHHVYNADEWLRIMGEPAL